MMLILPGLLQTQLAAISQGLWSQKMCGQTGIEGKTDHSLRATGATRLFEANVPEKMIKDCIGHRSLDALRMYEKFSVTQERAVSKILSDKDAKQFDSVVSESCQ